MASRTPPEDGQLGILGGSSWNYFHGGSHLSLLDSTRLLQSDLSEYNMVITLLFLISPSCSVPVLMSEVSICYRMCNAGRGGYSVFKGITQSPREILFLNSVLRWYKFIKAYKNLHAILIHAGCGFSLCSSDIKEITHQAYFSVCIHACLFGLYFS